MATVVKRKHTKVMCICTLIVLFLVERDLAVLLFNILLRIFVAKVSFQHFSDLTLNFKIPGVLTTAENCKLRLLRNEINIRNAVTHMVHACLHILTQIHKLTKT